MDIQMVNSMDFGEFVDVLGNIIEKCPLIAAAIWSQRPFTDLADLEKHVFDFIEALPQSESNTFEQRIKNKEIKCKEFFKNQLPHRWSPTVCVMSLIYSPLLLQRKLKGVMAWEQVILKREEKSLPRDFSRKSFSSKLFLQTELY
uniref:2-oxo-4-hydroxy-4-carboxy-5-ureidoimidazoline decarboxylase n=1 Tax=Phascolarctos cinereus TaxID=38626 RepID=A0A6P5L3J9_PHACI|nr:putative 2-oxo-4-hydroxy-4-carboxy-5-ureidoimidazoline decarboxylase isoform X2 [Phascolarctos cinereus]